MTGEMAKRHSRGSLPSNEQDGLSARIRELILGSKVEERRKQRNGDGSVSERRRRSDRITSSANRDS